jgi:uncharacterized protein YndB with AHSA1/START domain
VFEIEHSTAVDMPAETVWGLWADPGRWPDWDPRVESAEADTELADGVELRVRLKKGGTTRQRVTALEPGRRLVTEYRLPGARVGHDRLVEPRGPRSQVTHRLYVAGPLSGFWALMLGRKQMTETVAELADGV